MDDLDCTELLDSFVEIAEGISPGDTLILTLNHNQATLEILIDGISVFKQQRGLMDTTPKPSKATDRN